MHPLHAAVRAGDLARTTELLASGTDINVRGARNTTALHHVISDYATAPEHCFTDAHETVLRYLLGAGADLSLRSDDGWRALTLAAGFGNTRALGILLEHGDRLDPETEDWKALLFSATWRQPESIRILLACGADPDLRDPDGLTSLIRAVKKSHAPTVAALLEGGADPNLTDRTGWTALHHAATKANVEQVALLLTAGAHPAAATEDGETAADIARRMNKTKVLKALTGAGASE